MPAAGYANGIQAKPKTWHAEKFVVRCKDSKLGVETCTCVLQAAFVQRAVCSGVARMEAMLMTT